MLGASGILGAGHQVQTTAVEVDGCLEVLFVPESARRVLDPLNPGIDGLTCSVGNPVTEVRYDVLEASFQHARDVDHRLQTTSRRPPVPPAEVLPRRSLVRVFKQRHPGFLQCPGSRRFEVTVSQN